MIVDQFNFAKKEGISHITVRRKYLKRTANNLFLFKILFEFDNALSYKSFSQATTTLNRNYENTMIAHTIQS